MAIHSTKFLRKLNHLIDEMNRKDAAVINIDIIFMTLLVVHFWPELAQANRGWYFAAVIFCEIYLFQRLNSWGKNTSKKSKKSNSSKE